MIVLKILKAKALTHACITWEVFSEIINKTEGELIKTNCFISTVKQLPDAEYSDVKAFIDVYVQEFERD